MNIHYLTDYDIKLLKREIIDDCAAVAEDETWTAEQGYDYQLPQNLVRATGKRIAAKICKMKDKT